MRLSRMLLLAAVAAFPQGGNGRRSRERYTLPPARPCLQCGKTKQHNNAFCSAACCRAHKRGDPQDAPASGLADG